MNLKEKEKREVEERMKNCIYQMNWKKGSVKRNGERTKLNLVQKDRMRKAKGAMNLKVKEEGEVEVWAERKIYQMDWKLREVKEQKGKKRKLNPRQEDLRKKVKGVMSHTETMKDLIDGQAQSEIRQMNYKMNVENKSGGKMKT